MDTTANHGIGEKVWKKPKGIGENTRKKTKSKPFLPDDIIANIFCRLPAKKVSQCRLVCKGWRDLTLTRDFVDLHFLRNSLPMILVSNPRCFNKYKKFINSGSKDFVDYFLLDKWWELHARKKLTIHKFNLDFIDNEGFALFSHAGLVVFKNYSPPGCIGCSFIVGNPMYPENVRIITLSKEIQFSKIYGVFFHPTRKEYYSLWMILESDGRSHPKWIKYKMLSLGSNPSMKTISNLFSHRIKRPGSSSLFIDKYLYWMLEPENDKYTNHSDIMQFDIISEEFTVMPCPVPLDDDTEFSYYNTYLLNIDGTLSFLLLLLKKITIWRLEDHAQQLWTTASYTFTIDLYPDNGEPKETAIVDGKLAILSERRLIVCNLMQGTMYYRRMRYNHVVSFQPHQMSLASLTDCTSKIFIDQEGEVAQIVRGG